MAMRPQINNNLYSHTSLRIQIAGVNYQVTGCKSLNYDSDLEPGEGWGTDVDMMGRTTGQRKCSGAMELLSAEMDGLRQRLGKGYMRKPFNILLAYAEEGQPLRKVALLGVRIKKEGESSQAGNEAVTTKLDLHIMRVTINGIDPV